MGWTWNWLAIVAAVLTLLPAVRGAVNISADLARTIAWVAAGALLLWWVLFVLPVIGLTTAFLATLGVAAGVGAVWRQPGSEAGAVVTDLDASTRRGSRWSSRSCSCVLSLGVRCGGHEPRLPDDRDGCTCRPPSAGHRRSHWSSSATDARLAGTCASPFAHGSRSAVMLGL